MQGLTIAKSDRRHAVPGLAGTVDITTGWTKISSTKGVWLGFAITLQQMQEKIAGSSRNPSIELSHILWSRSYRSAFHAESESDFLCESPVRQVDEKADQRTRTTDGPTYVTQQKSVPSMLR